LDARFALGRRVVTMSDSSSNPMTRNDRSRPSWPFLNRLAYSIVGAALPAIGTVVLGVKNGAALHEEIGTWTRDIEYLAHMAAAGLLTAWFLRRVIRRDGIGNFVMKGAAYYLLLAAVAVLLVPASAFALDAFTTWEALGYSMAFFSFSLTIGAFFGIPVCVGFVLVLYPFAPPRTDVELAPRPARTPE
jgi:hypothetical protein